jgi:hypothetical protein
MPWQLLAFILIGVIFSGFPQAPVSPRTLSVFVPGMALPPALSFHPAARRERKIDSPPPAGKPGKREHTAGETADSDPPSPGGNYGIG